MCDTGRLLSVDGARTGQQKAARTARDRKVECPARALHDGIEHRQRLIALKLAASFGGRMDHIRKALLGKGKVAHVAGREVDRGMIAEVWSRIAKSLRRS